MRCLERLLETPGTREADLILYVMSIASIFGVKLFPITPVLEIGREIGNVERRKKI